MSQKILIVEDEERIAHWTQRYFEKAGFTVSVAPDGKQGLQKARDEAPDLILLDLMLPEIDGMTICRTLRAESDVPIIMLTARGTQRDRIEGLELGADDYIVKPFDPEEAVARAKAVLRRAGGTTQSRLQAGEIALDLNSHSVTVAGEARALSHNQFALLATMMRHPNQVLTREQLIEAALADFDGFDRAIDTHIRRLRRQIETDSRNPRYIHTVYGVGYKFVVEDA